MTDELPRNRPRVTDEITRRAPNQAPSPAIYHSEVNKDRTSREEKPRS